MKINLLKCLFSVRTLFFFTLIIGCGVVGLISPFTFPLLSPFHLLFTSIIILTLVGIYLLIELLCFKLGEIAYYFFKWISSD